MEYVEEGIAEQKGPHSSSPAARCTAVMTRDEQDHKNHQDQLAFVAALRTERGRARIIHDTKNNLSNGLRTMRDASTTMFCFVSTQLEPQQPLRRNIRSLEARVEKMRREHPETYATLRAISYVLLAGTAIYALRKGFNVVRTTEDLTPRMMNGRARLRGVVASVGDGDNFRFAHEPLFRRTKVLSGKDAKVPRGWLGKNTIHVRLAGVDAPECAHFGQPGQKHGPEALAWLRNALLNKKVTIRIFHKDQYQRAVSQVLYKPHWFSRTRDVSLELVKAGYGVVYRGAGEQHYGMKHVFEAAVEAAKKARKGMWRDGPDLMGPQEYKRLLKGGVLALGADLVSAAKANPSAGTLLQRGIDWIFKDKPVQASSETQES